jgi:pyruvate formate lyase activating enzyme
MKEALLYEKLAEEKVKCAVCNHRCVIAPGRRGICGVRENRQGTLYALNYGKCVAAHVDPMEKKPLYHFLPQTRIYSFAAVGCNFHCLWCQNWEISQSPKPDRPIEGIEITPAEHVERALAYACPQSPIPIPNRQSSGVCVGDHEIGPGKGLKNVWVTNGYMSHETLECIIPYLDAANVDFKGPNDHVYEKYCGATAEPIMENLKALQAAGVHQEITTLIVPGVNDQAGQLEVIASLSPPNSVPTFPGT